jgi:hypothetical protein
LTRLKQLTNSQLNDLVLDVKLSDLSSSEVDDSDSVIDVLITSDEDNDISMFLNYSSLDSSSHSDNYTSLREEPKEAKKDLATMESFKNDTIKS